MPTLPTADVFELVLARPVVLGANESALAGLVHLWWRAPAQGDRLVQVYLDGQLVDVTADPRQRELWLMCDPGRAHLVELLAVDAGGDGDQLHQGHPELLTSARDGATGFGSRPVALALVRDQRLPPDTLIQSRLDGQVIDQSPLWPAQCHRGGFGALFGLGGFGVDAATGPGLGAGDELGLGPLGAGGTAWRLALDAAAAGGHTLELRAVDPGGDPSVADPVSRALARTALPVPATDFTVDADFTLRWSG